jgi:hypothetical protein
MPWWGLTHAPSNAGGNKTVATHRHPARGRLVLGCDVPAGSRTRAMVLFVSDPRPLQPQDRRLRIEVHDIDSADHAAHLARRTALAEAVHAMPVRPVLHGDNGATLKATTVLAMLHWLGIRTVLLATTRQR